MQHIKLDNFYNRGFGWVCKNCEQRSTAHTVKKSRLMNEGEAESKNPVLSSKALAKWTDAKRNTLICPICKTIESVSKSN